jgi:hypothetical protein
MNTGSRDEAQYLANIGSIARSTAQIAECLTELTELAKQVAHTVPAPAVPLRGRNAQDDLATSQ